MKNPDDAIPLTDACPGSHKDAKVIGGARIHRCPVCKQRVHINPFGNFFRHRAAS